MHYISMTSASDESKASARFLEIKPLSYLQGESDALMEWSILPDKNIVEDAKNHYKLKGISL